MTIGPILYALGNSYWTFFVTEALWGVGVAFISGAKEALLYDSLSELGRNQEYVKINGRVLGIGNWSEGIASLVAGLAVLISFTAPFWITATVFAIALLIALSLVEPEREKLVHQDAKKLLALFLDTIHHNRALKWMIAFSVVTGIGTHIATWLYQPFFIEGGIDLVLFGPIWAATLFITGIGSWIAHHIDGKIGRHRALVLLLVLAVVGYAGIALGSFWIGLAIITLIQLSRGLNKPLLYDEINALTTASRRATVFSIRSFLHQIIYAPLIILVGFAAVGGVQPVFGMLAVGIGVLGALTLTFALVFHRSRIRV